MAKVTYRGPTDSADRTTEYRIRSHGKTYVLPAGVTVEVPADVATKLDADTGHRFDGAKKKATTTSRSTTGSTTPKPQED